MGLRKTTDVDERTDSVTVYQRGYRFAMGQSKNAPRTRPWIPQNEYDEAKELQSSKPISVGTILSGKKTWHKIPVRGKILWWYKDEFYVEDENHSPLAQTRENIKGLRKVTGVHEKSEDPYPGEDRYKTIPWWRKVTGAHEEREEDSLAREEKRYHFAIGTSNRSPRTPWISEDEYHEARKLQSSRPVSVGIIGSGKKTWYKIPVRGKTLWWYKDEFYVNEGHSPSEQRKEGITGLRKVVGVHEESSEAKYSHYEKRYCFAIGSQWDAPRTSTRMSKKHYVRAKELQSSEPVSVGTIEDGKHKGKTLWWYKDQFYAENDGYSSEQVQLLLWEKEQRQKRRFQRLRKEMLSERAVEEARRERIPEDVRIFVWKRDGGTCVQCGSQERLEFDHIIPVAKGGSNTGRNIQLLCETCNRRKSDHI